MNRPDQQINAYSTISSDVDTSLEPVWHGLNEPVEIQGFHLQSPMTYVGPAGQFREPSSLDPKLKVAQRNRCNSLGYWPNYSQMSEGQRRVYLEWMASGRTTLPSDVGYIFVFFYGLERRVLKEGDGAVPIFEEVARLRTLYLTGAETPCGRFLAYTKSFLWLLFSQTPELYSEKHAMPLLEDLGRWQEEYIASLLAWALAHYTYLPGWVAFAIGSNLPDSQRGISLKHAKHQIRRCFDERYREKWTEGFPLYLESPGHLSPRTVSYSTASAALSNFHHYVKVPYRLLQNLSSLGALYNECCNDLRRYGLLMAKQIQDEQDVDPILRWEALPPSLRTGEHPCQEVLSSVVNPIIARQQFVVVGISQLASLAKVPAREKYTGDHSARLARVVEYCGYSIEPDTRITGKAYASHETVVLFNPHAEQVDANRYNAACLMLRLGLLAASANDKPDKEQLNILAQHILEVFVLNNAEQLRIKALAGLLLRNGVDMVGARDLLQALTPVQREAIGKLLIAIAAHDGVITSEEKKSLRKCFDRLGLGTTVLDAHLNALRSSEGVTIVQRAKTRSSGEPIPAVSDLAKPEAEAIKLNRSAIEALLRDTREVQQALAQAMVVEEASHDEDGAQDSEELEANSFAGEEAKAIENELSLDRRYRPLYLNLIKREMWPIDEASALAREHQQMLSGALESMNEWTIEEYGGPLFYEEGDCVLVELELLN